MLQILLARSWALQFVVSRLQSARRYSIPHRRNWMLSRSLLGGFSGQIFEYGTQLRNPGIRVRSRCNQLGLCIQPMLRAPALAASVGLHR
jgi:hypothetical protein